MNGADVVMFFRNERLRMNERLYIDDLNERLYIDDLNERLYIDDLNERLYIDDLIDDQLSIETSSSEIELTDSFPTFLGHNGSKSLPVSASYELCIQINSLNNLVPTRCVEQAIEKAVKHHNLNYLVAETFPLALSQAAAAEKRVLKPFPFIPTRCDEQAIEKAVKHRKLNCFVTETFPLALNQAVAAEKRSLKPFPLVPTRCVEQAIEKAVKHHNLNCLVAETFPLALSQAAAAEKRGLKSFPVRIKDCFAVKHVPLTCSDMFSENASQAQCSHTTTVVKRLVKASGCIISKYYLDLFSIGSSSLRGYVGPVKSGYSSEQGLEDDWLVPTRCVEQAIEKAVKHRNLNCLVTETFLLALSQAAAAEKRVLKPFPVRIKDCFAVAKMASVKFLTDRVAIVTASTKGIGFAIAKRLGLDGAAVVVSSRKERNVKEAVTALRLEGVDCDGTVAHVGIAGDRKKLIDFTLDRYGKLDILVSNAAVNPHYGDLLTISDAQWDKLLQLNVQASFLLTKEAVPHLEKTGNGNIVFVSSLAGYAPIEGIGAYSIMKTALIGVNKTLSQSLAHRNIRVNAIAPGIIRTDFSKMLTDNPEASANVDVRRMIPLGRIGEADECAGAVSFLVSDEASYMTGETIGINGGMHSRF
ncbi:hypothetical protein QR680_002891 [Steinernema hermaphroditum]|uniref:Amidase domain-containing protein n=1 Tax=Steinernema hermaphroditum TaxID=289476 RepID=A0AA39LJ62_9BILA|nr:hypothetical protein QR680_002891 [Steinernema hermaphroditum]